MKKLNLALIGCGYWGPNYIRAFNELPKSGIKVCCDLDGAKRDKIKGMYPKIHVTSDYKDIAKHRDIDAVVVATPPDTHYRIVKHLLESGKHVLVEKPLTVTSSQARGLIRLASARRLTLMVGHIYEYNAGVRALKNFIDSGRMGDIYYIKAERMGLGPIRRQGSALWDLATHDISIFLHLLVKMPVSVSARGGHYIQEGIEDFVDLNLTFPGNILCTVYASWFAPEKIRRMTIVGSKAMAIFDDTNKSETLKVYERKIDKKLMDSTSKYSDHQNIVKMGKVYIPRIKQWEPMKKQGEDFINCVINGMNPVADALDGLRVVQILEKAQKSLRKNKGK
ncbi:MAG: Gfo/Idh/MocA family oxidoreductase [Candidatus Omnitrophota bacterium]